MIFIDINKLKPDQSWLDKSEELLKELISVKEMAKKKEIIDKATSQQHWKKLKADLKKLSYGKCWYSEAKEIYSHYHVDHFRPKKRAIDDTSGTKVYRDGYWWLTFKHTNYRLSGGVGNSAKSDHFAVKTHCANCPDDPLEDEVFYLLDPTNKEDPKKLRINDDGQIVPACQIEGHWDNLRAKYTIEKLDLNWPDLKDERAIKWGITQTLIDKIDALDLAYQNAPSVTNEQQLLNKLEEVRKLIAPCEELSGTVRACLKASRRDWAIELLAEDHDFSETCKIYTLPTDLDDDNE